MSKFEKAGREAFWGGRHTDILDREYPNGCTLKEAIDYFVLYGEEYETLGII